MIDDVFKEIREERQYQYDLWGAMHDNFHTPEEWVAILSTQLGQAARASMMHVWKDRDIARFRHELIQIAAVAVAAAEVTRGPE